MMFSEIKGGSSFKGDFETLWSESSLANFMNKKEMLGNASPSIIINDYSFMNTFSSDEQTDFQIDLSKPFVSTNPTLPPSLSSNPEIAKTNSNDVENNFSSNTISSETSDDIEFSNFTSHSSENKPTDPDESDWDHEDLFQ